MQTLSIPVIAPTPVAPAKAGTAPASPAAPVPRPPMPYGYPYGAYAWPGYGYYYPPVAPRPTVAAPAPAPAETSLPPSVDKPAKTEDKPAPKAKTPDEQAEDEILDVVRQMLRTNPKLKAMLTPEWLDKLKAVADNPKQLQSLVIETVAQGEVGNQVKRFMGTGIFSRLFKKFALWLSPPQTDPLLEKFFGLLSPSA